MEFDTEYNAYLAMTSAERIDAAYEAWVEAMNSAEYAETSADLDAMAYA
jgi:hypothetical protein